MTNVIMAAMLATNMVATNMSSHAWNFVVEAKNLTRDERECYNAAADSADMLRRYGAGSGARVVAEEVKTLDAIRELRKEVAGKTNVQWLGSVVCEMYTKLGDGTWDSAGPIRGRMAMPQYEIGLREDGVVVWRGK